MYNFQQRYSPAQFLDSSSVSLQNQPLRLNQRLNISSFVCQTPQNEVFKPRTPQNMTFIDISGINKNQNSNNTSINRGRKTQTNSGIKNQRATGNGEKKLQNRLIEMCEESRKQPSAMTENENIINIQIQNSGQGMGLQQPLKTLKYENFAPNQRDGDDDLVPSDTFASSNNTECDLRTMNTDIIPQVMDSITYMKAKELYNQFLQETISLEQTLFDTANVRTINERNRSVNSASIERVRNHSSEFSQYRKMDSKPLDKIKHEEVSIDESYIDEDCSPVPFKPSLKDSMILKQTYQQIQVMVDRTNQRTNESTDTYVSHRNSLSTQQSRDNSNLTKQSLMKQLTQQSQLKCIVERKGSFTNEQPKLNLCGIDANKYKSRQRSNNNRAQTEKSATRSGQNWSSTGRSQKNSPKNRLNQSIVQKRLAEQKAKLQESIDKNDKKYQDRLKKIEEQRRLREIQKEIENIMIAKASSKRISRGKDESALLIKNVSLRETSKSRDKDSERSQNTRQVLKRKPAHEQENNSPYLPHKSARTHQKADKQPRQPIQLKKKTPIKSQMTSRPKNLSITQNIR
ncbi:UNKNOWN [Stylonychia lemnae]|uniref:Uncharacterized protein n=1 Tax=Stylonychia lemnae TaxID=5949 RepID=A0A078ASH1_STYLE|nr:UNKNOWN [Stylonychia lemnae]|eukprot:CDW83838.1 UNKNOWN [Stylonychia lemnae]